MNIVHPEKFPMSKITAPNFWNKTVIGGHKKWNQQNPIAKTDIL